MSDIGSLIKRTPSKIINVLGVIVIIALILLIALTLYTFFFTDREIRIPYILTIGTDPQSLKERIVKLEKENKELKNLISKKILKSKYDDLKKEYEKKISNLSMEITFLRSEIDKKNQELVKSINAPSDLKVKIALLKKEKKDIENKFSNLNKNIGSQQKKITQLQDENKKLKIKLSAITNSIIDKDHYQIINAFFSRIDNLLDVGNSWLSSITGIGDSRRNAYFKEVNEIILGLKKALPVDIFIQSFEKITPGSSHDTSDMAVAKQKLKSLKNHLKKYYLK